MTEEEWLSLKALIKHNKNVVESKKESLSLETNPMKKAMYLGSVNAYNVVISAIEEIERKRRYS